MHVSVDKCKFSKKNSVESVSNIERKIHGTFQSFGYCKMTIACLQYIFLLTHREKIRRGGSVGNDHIFMIFSNTTRPVEFSFFRKNWKPRANILFYVRHSSRHFHEKNETVLTLLTFARSQISIKSSNNFMVSLTD